MAYAKNVESKVGITEFTRGIRWVQMTGKEEMFSRILIHLNFGSDDDPKNKRGMSHFLEHYLTFGMKDKLSKFGFEHSAAHTGNNAIEFEFTIPNDEVEQTIRAIMEYLSAVDFNANLFYEQKLKVMYEIATLKRSEESIWVEREDEKQGYYSPIGKLDDVSSILPSELYDYYYEKVSSHGGIVTIVAPKEQWISEETDYLSRMERGRWGVKEDRQCKMVHVTLPKQEAAKKRGRIYKYTISERSSQVKFYIRSIRELFVTCNSGIRIYDIDHRSHSNLYIYVPENDESDPYRQWNKIVENIDAQQKAQSYLNNCIALEGNLWMAKMIATEERYSQRYRRKDLCSQNIRFDFGKAIDWFSKLLASPCEVS